MIYLVVGKPRTGKGLFLMQHAVVETLLNTNQNIVTNFAIKVPELHEWIQKNYPHRKINVPGRITFIPKHEVRRYYLIRGDGQRIKPASKEEKEAGIELDYSAAVEPIEVPGADPDDEKEYRYRPGWYPVCYILDEIDSGLGARDWAKNGKEFNSYDKQHGKMGDTVWFCCQNAMQVDSLVRAVVQFTFELKNWGKITYAGFRLPSVFKWKEYMEVPKESDEHINKGKFTFRSLKGLQHCYRTQAGYGMSGVVGADSADKVKGRSIWWFAPVALMIIAAVYLGPGYLKRKYMEKFGSGASEAVKAVSVSKGSTNSIGASFREMVTSAMGVRPGSEPARVVQVEKPVEIYFVGYVKIDGKFRVYFSNGTSISSDNPLLEYLSDEMAIVNGKQYMRRASWYSSPVVTQSQPVQSVAVEPVPVAAPVQPPLVWEQGFDSTYSNWRIVVK